MKIRKTSPQQQQHQLFPLLDSAAARLVKRSKQSKVPSIIHKHCFLFPLSLFTTAVLFIIHRGKKEVKLISPLRGSIRISIYACTAKHIYVCAGNIPWYPLLPAAQRQGHKEGGRGGGSLGHLGPVGLSWRLLVSGV